MSETKTLANGLNFKPRSMDSAVGLASVKTEAWQRSTVAPTDVGLARAVPRSNFEQLNAYHNCSAANLTATRRDVATSRYGIGGKLYYDIFSTRT